VPEFLTCFACEQDPTQQCPRCGRPYCDDHGEDVCDACLNPASGLPSFTLYRGSLLALLVGVLVAVWLLVQPPGGGESNAPQTGTIITPTPQVQVQTTPPAGTTPGATGGTPQGNATPRPNATATPSTSGGGGSTYTVVAGDTLSSICERVKPATMSVTDCVDQLRSLNSLSGDSISIGQTLRTP
jgi:LysM repeat protein